MPCLGKVAVMIPVIPLSATGAKLVENVNLEKEYLVFILNVNTFLCYVPAVWSRASFAFVA